MQDYTIQKGDTLGGLASKYNTDVATLAKTNNIADPNKIYAGSSLKVPDVMNAGAIQGVQTSPVAPPPTTTTSNLGLLNNSIASGIQADSTATSPTVSPERAKQEGMLSGLMSKITGQAAETGTIIDESGLQEKKLKAKSISNELDSLDKGFRDEVTRIKTNPQGKLEAGVQSEINQAQDRYENRRANISLAFKVANDDFQGVQETVNAKVNALKDQNAQALQAFQLYSNFVNNDMSESEKQKAQEQFQIKQAKAKTLEDAYAGVLKMATQNKAPASILNAIDTAMQKPNATAASVYAAAGQYATDPSVALEARYKQAQINSLQAKTTGSSPNGQLSSTTLAVIDNPNLLNSLTPTIKSKVITELQAAGYDTTRLGAKPLSDTAINLISQDQTALDSLNELKQTIKGNEQYLGPISGFQVLNPYSPARVLQAKVDLVRQKVGKALEGGVLRKEDEDKYKKILTTLNDTPNLSQAKIDNLIQTIQTGINNYTALQTGAGKSANVTGSLEKKGATTTPVDSTSYRSKYGY